MQVFKAYMKILKKKLPSSIIYIVVFLAVSLNMAQAGGVEDKFKAATLTMCIYDEDNTEESRALTEFIGKKHEIKDVYSDNDAMIDALYYESIDYVLVIEQGYAEKLASGETDGLFGSYHMHDSYGTVYMKQFLDEYAGTVQAYMAGGKSLSEAISSTEEALSLETEVAYAKFDDDNSSADYPQKFSYYFQYMPYILISVMLNSLCPVLLVLNRKDIRYRTNCSSVKPNSYTLQIFAGSTIFFFALWLIFMAAGVFMYGGIYQGKAWLAVLNSFIFALVSAAIAVLVSSFNPSANIVNLITQVIGLGMSFFCGIFVPQSMLADGVLAAARFLPAYWYVRANDMLAGREIFDASLFTEFMLIEAAFAVVLAILTLLIRRVNYSAVSLAKAHT